MTIELSVLFSLSVSHTYYGGRCRDFGYALPTDTLQRLRNGRMTPRTLDGKLYVLVEGDEGGTARVSVPGMTLRLGLVLLNPYFCNFTTLNHDPGSVAALYQNQPNPSQLAELPAVRLVGPIFSHTLSDPARPVNVTVANSAGTILGRDTVPAGDPRPTVSFDLTGNVPGPLVLQESYATTNTTTAYYLDAELTQQQVFGIVEVRIDDAFYAATAELNLQFTAKQDTLKYYVVANNYAAADVAQLRVKDTGFAEEARPEILFTAVPPGAFTAAELDPVVLGGGPVMLFESQNPVARAAAGRKKIQLQRGGQVVVTHLPQPRPESTKADLIVHVAKT